MRRSILVKNWIMEIGLILCVWVNVVSRFFVEKKRRREEKEREREEDIYGREMNEKSSPSQRTRLSVGTVYLLFCCSMVV